MRFRRANELREAGLYPYFRCIESAQDTEVLIDGRRMLMLGSNSYMGLTNDPRVKEAVKKAIDQYGSGCAGSRFLNGTLKIHIELEEEIADFMNKEAALTFTTGMQANLGAIAAMVGKDDHVFIDRADHASIMDGCRLGFGKIHKFRHNDMENLERVLRQHDATGKLIVVDGVYSMEGDLARLPEIVALARRYHAGILVDDAHGIGVLGSHGQGTASHFGLEEEVELIAGTFSKSVASIGGFVAGDACVIDYLKHHARALIFSASMAPACVAAARAAIRIIRDEPERRQRLWDNTHYLMSELQRMGFDTGDSETPIIPIVIGDTIACFRFWAALHEAGIFVNPVVAPATPPNRALIRLSVMATHTREQLAFALEAIERIGKRSGVLDTLR
ncbi:MAG: pyridoxal phosphate-dependent aminotransferase family protein [Candidatus Sumerlaeia bacterium]|nr:pyridoxal phosphate-dependent aminotransferase family protein [Candidatus Sumerlaeia bacterium]